MTTDNLPDDLRPGDVVAVAWDCHPGVTVSGPLRSRAGGHWVGPVPVIGPNGEMYAGLTLAVVSRAPRPLYVNHPRTEPVPGDVVRSADRTNTQQWMFDGCWFHTSDGDGNSRTQMPARLRLLVDGETGQVVP